MLDPDEHQEQLHAARRSVAAAALMWQAIDEHVFPGKIKHRMFLAWWKEVIHPQVQIPDFSGLFGAKDDE